MSTRLTMKLADFFKNVNPEITSWTVSSSCSVIFWCCCHLILHGRKFLPFQLAICLSEDVVENDL
jgi:hypothetical protein